MKRFRSVDDYIDGAEHWQAELRQLRTILLSTELEETVKWGAPCYTHAGKNLVGLGAFKSYVGLWFYQGALLSDPENVLINAQSEKTKAMRQWRFDSEKSIKTRLIKKYVAEAIRLQDQGMEIKPSRDKPVLVPPELKEAMRDSQDVAEQFEQLTKGRQREYAEYIESAKRAETKRKRIEKIIPMIRAGAGLNDKYRKS